MSADDLSHTDPSSLAAEADVSPGRSTRATSVALERPTATYCSMQRTMHDY